MAAWIRIDIMFACSAMQGFSWSSCEKIKPFNLKSLKMENPGISHQPYLFSWEWDPWLCEDSDKFFRERAPDPTKNHIKKIALFFFLLVISVWRHFRLRLIPKVTKQKSTRLKFFKFSKKKWSYYITFE